MLTLFITIIAFIVGFLSSKRRGGVLLDQLQWGAGFALAGFTIMIILSVIIHNFLA